MACINADGTLTRSGEIILLALHAPGTPEEVARDTGIDLFMVRGAMREFMHARYVEKEKHLFRITPKGLEALEGADEKNS